MKKEKKNKITLHHILLYICVFLAAGALGIGIYLLATKSSSSSTLTLSDDDNTLTVETIETDNIKLKSNRSDKMSKGNGKNLSLQPSRSQTEDYTIIFPSELQTGVLTIDEDGKTSWEKNVANISEVYDGSNTLKAVTPYSLSNWFNTRIASNSEVVSGNLTNKMITPSSLKNWKTTNVPTSTEDITGLAKIATDVEIYDNTNDAVVITPKKLSQYVTAKFATYTNFLPSNPGSSSDTFSLQLVNNVLTWVNGDSSDFDGTYAVFALIGQSNMHGDAAYDSEIDTTDSDIFQLGRKSPNNLSIIAAQDPLDHYTKTSNTIGIGMTFAKAYLADNPTHRVVLIPGAQSGTGFANNYWNVGDSLYLDIISRINTVIALTDTDTYVLKAILWHQGEADDKVLNDANNYSTNFDAMVNGIRGAITDGSTRTLFISGGLCHELLPNESNGTHLYPQTVIDSLKGSLTRLGGTRYTYSTSLVSHGDSIHFNAVSMRTFGDRYYDSYIRANYCITRYGFNHSSGSTATDYSGFGYDMTDANMGTAGTWVNDSTKGRYVWRCDSGGISLSDSTQFSAVSSLTEGSISFWWKGSTLSNSNNYFLFALEQDVNGQEYGMFQSGGQTYFGLRSASTSDPYYFLFRTPTPFSSSVWTHICITLSSTNGLHIYLDGELNDSSWSYHVGAVATFSQATQFFARAVSEIGAHTFTIASKKNTTGGTTFHSVGACVSNFEIFGVVLSANQVTGLYNEEIS